MDVDLGNLTLFSSELPESDMLIETATRLTQELISNIFQLPVEKSSVGPLAQLPTPTTPLPREKPVCIRFFTLRQIFISLGAP